MPAAVAGTSIVALSLSSVTSGVSTSTRSPGFTSTSMHGDVLEVAEVRHAQTARSGGHRAQASLRSWRRHGIARSSPCTSASAVARKVVKRTASAPSITR